MMSVVNEKQDAIRTLCQVYHVQRLDVFGSVTSEAFDPSRSDIDFLVEFECSSPAMHYECYFGLLEGLEKLFGRHVDLVEYALLRNPYFRETVDETREVVYAA
jgi:predicted nucleotidyltransferase